MPSATAAGALIAAPTDVDHWMAPVAGSSGYIVPAFVPTYSASPSTGDTDEVPFSGVLQSAHLRVPGDSELHVAEGRKRNLVEIHVHVGGELVSEHHSKRDRDTGEGKKLLARRVRHLGLEVSEHLAIAQCGDAT